MQTRLKMVMASVALALLACAHAEKTERSSTEAAGTGSGQAAAEPSGSAPAPPERAATPGAPEEPGMLPDAASKEAQAQESSPAQTVVGRVEQLEGESLTLKSSPLSDPRKLTLRDDTRYLHRGASISRDDIEQGDMVRATFVGEGDAGAATEVVVIEKARPEGGRPEGPPGGPPGEARPESGGASPQR